MPGRDRRQAGGCSAGGGNGRSNRPLSEGFRSLGETSQKVIELVRGRSGCRRVRVAFSSASTLFERTSVTDGYRFLHIFAQQIRSMDALGVYTPGFGTDHKDVQDSRPASTASSRSPSTSRGGRGSPQSEQ